MNPSFLVSPVKTRKVVYVPLEIHAQTSKNKSLDDKERDLEKKLTRLQKSLEESKSFDEDRFKEIERMFIFSCVLIVGSIGIAFATFLHMGA